MKTKKGIALLLLFIVVLAMTSVVASGCGGVSQQEAEAKFKANLQNFKTSLQGLMNPANLANADSLNAAFKDIEKAYNDLVKSAKQVKSANITALGNAWNDLKKAVDNISSNQSLSQKAEAITESLQELMTALQRLLSTFNLNQ